MRNSTLKTDMDEVMALLLDGSLKEARRRLDEIMEGKVPRASAGQLGFMLRRADRPATAVTYLRRYVFRGGRMSSSATDEEIAEYAMSIGQLGAIHEGLELLESVSEKNYPNAGLYRTMLMFHEHRYDDAIPLLRQLAEKRELSPGTMLAVRVRLAHALTMTEPLSADARREAHALAKEIFDDTATRKKYARLARYALLVDGWAFLFHKEYDLARKRFEQLHRDGNSADDEEHILEAEMWALVADLAEAPAAKRAALMGKLEKTHEGLQAIGEWEIVRVAELFRAVFTGDEELLVRLYVGSPHPAFRARLKTTFEALKIKLPTTADWRLGEGAREPVVVEVANGLHEGAKSHLKEGQVMQRAFQIMSSEFYRPLRLPEIHASLYPGTSYDTGSSPERVHRVLRRLRAWFREQGLPLLLVENQGFYRLASERPCVIRLTLEGGARAPVVLRRMAETARAAFKTEAFSTAELARVLSKSVRSATAYARQAVANGLFERIGAGPATRYRVR